VTETVEELKEQLKQAVEINRMGKEYAESLLKVAQKYAQDAEMMRRVIFTLVYYRGGSLAIPLDDIVEREFKVEQSDEYLYLDVVGEVV
jgi:hypothetical protein